MPSKDDLIAHLLTGAATTCHAWMVVRKDGQIYGFTDHDNDVEFDSVIFKANSGLTAGALQSTSGLAVDNTEVTGAFSADGITESDLMAGRFDGASVTTWIVNWANLDQRTIRSRSSFGEIQRSYGSFKVELRGLADILNQQKGQVYQSNCGAVLGDAECRFNLDQTAFSLEASIQSIESAGSYILKAQPDYPAQWFERGQVSVTSGQALGQQGVVKFDREVDGRRIVTLWVDFDVPPRTGDLISLRAGCDKLATTCRSKFANFLNFRGFPHVPSTDWVASYPVSSQRNDGGSRQT